MSKSNKSANFYLAILVAAILVIALIAAIITNNSTKPLPAGSPERTVQQYLQSLNDGRNDLAAALFSKESSCTVQDIDRAYVWRNAHVTLLKTTVVGDIATIRVSIQRDGNNLMDSSNEEEVTYRLVRVNGEWRISGIPWPLYDCEGIRK